MKTVQTEIPEKLYKGAVDLAKEGWYRDEKEVFAEAIRRFQCARVQVTKSSRL